MFVLVVTGPMQVLRQYVNGEITFQTYHSFMRLMLWVAVPYTLGFMMLVLFTKRFFSLSDYRLKLS